MRTRAKGANLAESTVGAVGIAAPSSTEVSYVTPGTQPEDQSTKLVHTPTPWDDASNYPEFASVRIFAGSHYIATVGNSDDTKAQTEANAEFIVRACSSHEELVAALQYVVNCFDRESCDPMLTLDPVQAIARAKYAIAKAEGR